MEMILSFITVILYIIFVALVVYKIVTDHICTARLEKKTNYLKEKLEEVKVNDEIINSVQEEICEQYCQYQQMYGHDESCEYILNEHCDNCPLNELNKIRS